MIKAYSGAEIFDGEGWISGCALVVDEGVVKDITPDGALKNGVIVERLAGGMLVPGFVDLQVNGGGGVMLNDQRDVGAIAAICAAHAQFGTTALLATLITDTTQITEEAIRAGAAAREVPGFLGLHLEGPHLSIARKGAHDPQLIRAMQPADLDNLIAARKDLPILLTTVAPESVSVEQIARLVEAGLVVSIGHTDAAASQLRACADAGASVVTHLFNAMSQLGNREPGIVGGALDDGRLYAGLIADGFHVDARSIGVALRAKRGPGRIFLVTDAMATIGSTMTSFMLNGRTIHRKNGRLTLDDGTLAGADLDMISAVRFMRDQIGLDLGEALRMASLYPAMAVKVDSTHGRLANGYRADFVHLSGNLDIRATWIGGERVFAG
jgi:N-acetylglucosamine-6-phosphate deacetylase